MYFKKITSPKTYTKRKEENGLLILQQMDLLIILIPKYKSFSKSIKEKYLDQKKYLDQA